VILTCRTQPVSYLRLERYLQGDVDTRERLRVEEHLQACAACRACFESLQHEVIELLPLPALIRQQSPSWGARVRRYWPQLTAAAAIAAAVTLWPGSDRDPETPALPPARVAIKGGELALELLRERAGTVTAGAERFAAGDRFQVRVSCPPGSAVHWDLVVFQADQVFFPLTPSALLSCANGVTLPGAFTLDGAAAADTCVIMAASAAPDRSRLREPTAMRELGAACVRIEPVETR
jgi:Putative zinc-finger